MKKNFICILFTIAMLLFCNVTTYAQQSQSIKNSPNLSPWKEQVVGGVEGYIVGDVNGDEKVDISDIVAIINIIAKNDKSNQRADVNDDGEIDISDIVKVINIMANPYKPLSINKNSLVLWTREYGSVWINSGNGKYEVTNENPNIVSVEGFSDWWVSPRKSPSMTEAGQTTISDRKETPEYYDNIDYLEITALQPGSAVVRIKDVLSKQEQSINITVKERVIDDIYPDDYETIEGTSVAFRFTVNHPWTGDLNCRVCLEDWGGEIVKTADITVNGTEGEKTYYNQDGKIITFSDLKPNTAYDWTIYYYDKNESDTIECYSSSLYTEPAPTDISELCPDSNHPHIIDMGEAGKWACCNVGASSPEETGGQYAWGETTIKSVYEWSNYSLCDGSKETCYDIGNKIAGTRYDAAYVNWGESWRLPNSNQSNALLNLEAEWAKVNGVVGTIIKSPNGNSIFLPYVDRYWTSSASSYPTCFGSYPIISYDSNMFEPHLFHGERDRCEGLYVRPVYYENLCPDSNHPHIIDMGEAGKWACCNVDASSPEDYGGYYAWGETEEKSYYSEDTYKYYNPSTSDWQNLGSDIAGTQYDVAHVKWGGDWCMPSYDQIQLLVNLCTSEWTIMNGVNGRKVKGPNGATIFLPTAGLRWDGPLDYAGSDGWFWSSTQNPNYSSHAYYLSYNSRGLNCDYCIRYRGLSVRPIINVDPAVSAGLCPDSNHPHVIDMGVAGKWSCCNVGASAPWE